MSQITQIAPSIVLNQDQEAAMLKAGQFILKVDENCGYFFCITGSAGTGKTTTMKSLIQYIKDMGFKGRIGVTAPTHQAKKVISNSTGYPACTIQLLLGLRPDTDLETFDPNLPEFAQIGDKKISEYDLIIIDEASMCNKGLCDLLKKECAVYKTKILFMGDLRQLPPINEKLATCLSLPDEYSAHLNIIMRQESDNPILNLTQAICNDIDNDTNTFMRLIIDKPVDINSMGKGYCIMKNKDFINKTFELFKSEQHNLDNNYVKYLAYKNTTIEAANVAIRNHVFDNPKDTIVLGDTMLAYKSVTKMIGRQIDNILTNSDEYKVIRVYDEIYEHKIMDTEYKIPVYSCILEGFDKRIIKVNILKPEGFSIFADCVNYRLNIAKKVRGGAWKSYYNLKADVLVMDKLMKNLDKLCDKDIHYNYGKTVHKSQGSTYDNVCINLNNINSNQSKHERDRLIYVAVSRARSNCYILY